MSTRTLHELKEEEPDEDIIDQEMLDEIEELSRDEYKVDEILNETYLDLEEIAHFLQELKKFKPANDDKLKALVKLLKSDPVLKGQKVLIFSEFMATARYLRKQLEEAGIEDVEEVDSATKADRCEIIRRFAPYYNRPPQGEVLEGIDRETRILISTDVLSEGLNLQDATRLINYDLHWNPVRLMQRIGRVDRRLNPEIEAQMVADHPELKEHPRKGHLLELPAAGGTGRPAAPLFQGLPQDPAHFQGLRHRGQEAAPPGGRFRGPERLQPPVRGGNQRFRGDAPGVSEAAPGEPRPGGPPDRICPAGLQRQGAPQTRHPGCFFLLCPAGAGRSGKGGHPQRRGKMDGRGRIHQMVSL